jgi:hypothetical protein
MVYNFTMAADPRIAAFFDQALAAGIPHTSVVGILAARGWPEKDIYEALADHYQRATGIEIPRRTGSGASAREAFFYLLIFSTLATWTIGFGCLAFALIEYWFADPLFAEIDQGWGSYTITYSLATLIVAFPLYLLISRIVVREAAAHPEKLDSAVRKWLTYMALVIAACVFTGDLITALAYLLRGELTSRFVLKSLVVLVLSGGVFYYYFGGLRKTDAADSSKSAARWNRDRVMALLCTSLVAVLIILGFTQSGPPRVQRDLRADSERIQNLFQITANMTAYWASHNQQMPASLDQLPGASLNDPVTGAPYIYHPKQGSQYELCATFSRKSERGDNRPGAHPWVHPAGYHCFSLDATAGGQAPPYRFY